MAFPEPPALVVAHIFMVVVEQVQVIHRMAQVLHPAPAQFALSGTVQLVVHHHSHQQT
jgi:hypothetical protein